ncbi:hypothetical protein ACZ11_19170 [Lysinibacillus xylanilyticus]|uniref:Uncharacterized protein n=1 Tax=Lysinibacillus xylanilyticus TaxID=582475 RepID=A0A0K9F3R2_9BACI|nr:hypothetical protein ACZ11_19170 [Lysinibacillus xylanilyticus]
MIGVIGRPQEALLCAKAKRQRQMFICAKAKRQQQSAQPERKSPPLFLPRAIFFICHLNFIGTVVFRQQKSPLTVASGDFLSCFKWT